VFDEARSEYAWVRERLAGLMPDAELAAARRTTLNAHYTDAALVQAIWQGVRSLGFTGGRVLEPGCGSGNFIAFAPAGAQVTGIELDPVTAGIAAALHPQADIRAESFADTRDGEASYDAAIGNVPFGKIVLRDKRHNAGGHAIHNHAPG
jgi:predicted RNA methylase